MLLAAILCTSASFSLEFVKVLYCFFAQTASDDLKWWQSTLETLDGKSFFLLDKWTPTADLQLQTDASGTLGYGAFYAGRWLHGSWRPSQESKSIQFKELYAIVVACSTWASAWQRLRIQFQRDNSAVVDCIRSGTYRSADVMSLIRALYSTCPRCIQPNC